MQKIVNSLVLLSLTCVLSACISSKDETFFGTTVPKHGPNEIWINNGAEPQYIDPQKASGVPDGEIARNMFSRLTEIHPKTGQAIGDLAERWEVSQDGTEFTFFMRPGLVWSDGKPITAHDVEWSWKRLLDPATASVYASLAFDIVNGDAYHLNAVFIYDESQTVAESENNNLNAKNSDGSSDNAKTSEKNVEAKVVQLAASKFSNSHLSEESIKKALKGLEIGNVKVSNAPKGYMVYAAGKDKASVRKAILKKVNEDKILGASMKARVSSKDDVRVKALDDQRFWVKLTGPLPYFLALIEFNIFAPTPRHVIEKVTQKHGRDDLWVRPENIVCSGAYCLESEEFRQNKVFIKNPKYWNAKNTRLDKVLIRTIESANTTLFMYRTGEIDWSGASTDIPLEYIKTLKHLEDFHNDPYLGVYYYGFNVNRKPLDDVRVRRALAMAVDRVAVSRILGGGEVPFADMVLDGLAGYKAVNTPLFEAEKAKKLLAEAGFPNGKGFPKLEIMYNTQEKHKQIAQAIQQMWKENLNVDIGLSNKEWKVYLDDMTSQNYDIVRRGWIGDFIDPYTFLELSLSTSGNNRTGWGNKDYDRLIREANKQSDYTKRLELFREAEKITSHERPTMPIFIYNRTYLKKPFLKGFFFDYQGHHLWKYMWVDKRYYKKGYHKEIDQKDDMPQMGMVWPEQTITLKSEETK